MPAKEHTVIGRGQKTPEEFPTPSFLLLQDTDSLRGECTEQNVSVNISLHCRYRSEPSVLILLSSKQKWKHSAEKGSVVNA